MENHSVRLYKLNIIRFDLLEYRNTSIYHSPFFTLRSRKERGETLLFFFFVVEKDCRFCEATSHRWFQKDRETRRRSSKVWTITLIFGYPFLTEFSYLASITNLCSLLLCNYRYRFNVNCSTRIQSAGCEFHVFIYVINILLWKNSYKMYVNKYLINQYSDINISFLQIAYVSRVLFVFVRTVCVFNQRSID